MDLYIEILERTRHPPLGLFGSLGVFCLSPSFFPNFFRIPTYLHYFYSTHPFYCLLLTAGRCYCCPFACALLPLPPLPCPVACESCICVYIITCTYHILRGRTNGGYLLGMGRWLGGVRSGPGLWLGRLVTLALMLEWACSAYLQWV